MECIICNLGPENAQVPAMSVFCGFSLCEKHLVQVSDAFVDGYSPTVIIKDTKSGNF